MKVLLSIKPEYANKIFDGSKKFEFRRSIFKESSVKTIVVYASSPVKRIIGEFEIKNILLEDLDILWKKTKKFAGIEKQFFYKYFTEKKAGYAIEIINTKLYKKPVSLQERYNIVPPQSFLYLSKK
jgi:predicted transcriptional regulator